MKLEPQVVSLELAKKLKELGVNQASLFFYSKFTDGSFEIELSKSSAMGASDFSAFTVAELGEMLPAQLPGPSYKHPAYRLAMEKQDTRWNIVYICATCGGREFEPMLADTEADARATMLIYLLENELLPLEQPKQV